jgi:hypothetical protein
MPAAKAAVSTDGQMAARRLRIRQQFLGREYLPKIMFLIVHAI